MQSPELGGVEKLIFITKPLVRGRLWDCEGGMCTSRFSGVVPRHPGGGMQNIRLAENNRAQCGTTNGGSKGTMKRIWRRVCKDQAMPERFECVDCLLMWLTATPGISRHLSRKTRPPFHSRCAIRGSHRNIVPNLCSNSLQIRPSFERF